MKSWKFRPVSLPLVALLFALAAPTLPAAAQVAPSAPGRLLMIHQELADPARLAEYERTTKAVVAAAVAHSMSALPFNWTTVMVDDLSYLFIVPIESFADVGRMPQGFDDLAARMGKEKFGQLMSEGAAAMRSWNDFVVLERLDLSYQPAKPRLKPEEATTFRYDTYYLLPGREAEAEQVARDWAAAMARIGFTDGFTVYQGASGHDLPALVAVIPGKSAADIAERSEALDRALGADGQALRLRTMGLVRRFESHYGTLRPDLSYHPAAAEAKAASGG